MAIQKRFIHFKKFSDFNSKKLSANEANTQYTVGVSGEIQNGDPDILYQSYVWIKDTQQQWTHGRLYNGIDTPIIKGDAENSAILEGEYDGYSNKAISKTSVALGGASNAGLKGWYYSGIDFTNNKIYLSKTQPNSIKTSGFTTDTTITLDDIQGPEEGLIVKKRTQYIAGDSISIVCDAKYENKCKITAVEPGIITVDAIPFTSDDLPSYTLGIGKMPDDFTLYSVMPEVNSTTKQLTVRNWNQGGIDLGGASLAEGANTYAVNVGAHAEGIQTVAYGQYSHTEGFGNKAGYAAHAEGKNNTAIGEQSHAEGYNNITYMHNSHVEGNLNINRGVASHIEGRGNVVSTDPSDVTTTTSSTPGNLNYSHVEGLGNALRHGYAGHLEGYENVVYGNYGHVEGYKNTIGDADTIVNGVHIEGVRNTSYASGVHIEGADNVANSTATHSHIEGRYNITNNLREHAQGIYNVSNDKTIHSVGIGTSNTKRKNAHEILSTGEHYIYGIGGYDGTNPTDSDDLATYIKSLETRIAELENTINILTQNSKLDSATLDNLQLV